MGSYDLSKLFTYLHKSHDYKVYVCYPSRILAFKLFYFSRSSTPLDFIVFIECMGVFVPIIKCMGNVLISFSFVIYMIFECV